MSLTPAQRRFRNAAKKSVAMANRCRELRPSLIEALHEAATAREWMCPTHGPVGLNVNVMNACVQKVGKGADGSVELCGEICERNGPLLCGPKEIAAADAHFARQAASREIVFNILGVGPKGTQVGSSPVKNGLVLNLTVDEYKLLSPETQKELEGKFLNQLGGKAGAATTQELPAPAEAASG